MGFLKMILALTIWVIVCGSVTNVPDWSKLLGLAMILAGFVAHRSDS